MNIQSKKEKWIEVWTRILLIGLLMGYLGCATAQPATPSGESGSFTLSLVSLLKSGDFAISDSDYETAIQWFPEHQAYLDGYYHDFMPTDNEGIRYPWYFGAYSFLCIPVLLVLRLLRLDVIYSFAITNALLLAGTLYLVYRECKLGKRQRLLLILFLGCSPIIRYIFWQSYEVATCSFVIAAMVYWFTGRRNRGALCLAIAGTMNPTVMAFGIFMILEYFFERLREDQWNVPRFVRRCLSDWKEIALYALCFVPCLIPMGISYMIFANINPAAMLGLTDVAGMPVRVLAYFFDLNFGLLPYVPLLLLLLVALVLFAVRNKNWKYLFAILGILGTVAAYSLTLHINCGMTGIARYNAWLLPMLIFTAVYAIQDGALRPIPKKCATGVVGVSLCWCVFTVAVVYYGPTGGGYVYWEPYAKLTMEYAPQLYNPLPTTFNSRTMHVDGGFGITAPVIFSGQDGYVRKILMPTALGKEALDDLVVVGEEDRAYFESESKKIESGKEFCYLNFPAGKKIQNALRYYQGGEILFTLENNGTKYFSDGISTVETNFAWSNGLSSRMLLNIGEIKEDLPVQFDFLNVFGGQQTLIVTSHGQELFHEVITQENPHAAFTIPQELVENGVIALECSYPNAVDLSTLGSSDARVIALGWKRMVFGTATDDGETDYMLGDEILFTPENDGTKYFSNGISIVETNFAWSDGTESEMTVHTGPTENDISTEFYFQNVFNGQQTLIVSSHGRELFHEIITQETPYASFTIPQKLVENGVISLNFSYPDAVDLMELSNGTDGRTIALGWQKIIFN